MRATCRPPRRPASQGGEPPRTRDALLTSRAGLRVVLQVEEVTLALTHMLGSMCAVFPAALPFACGSDGGRSNRVAIRSRSGRGLCRVMIDNGAECAIVARNCWVRLPGHAGPRPVRGVSGSVSTRGQTSRHVSNPLARGYDGRYANCTAVHSRVGQGRESGDACRSRSTGNRIYCPARSLLACV